MCSRYPKCGHIGLVMDKIAGFERHCETILPNHECPYLEFGCRGCTNSTSFDWRAAIGSIAHNASITLQVKDRERK